MFIKSCKTKSLDKQQDKNAFLYNHIKNDYIYFEVDTDEDISKEANTIPIWNYQNQVFTSK